MTTEPTNIRPDIEDTVDLEPGEYVPEFEQLDKKFEIRAPRNSKSGAHETHGYSGREMGHNLQFYQI